MPVVTIRPAAEEDLDRVLDIHTSAYPDPRGEEPRRRNLVANPWGPLTDLRVAEVDGVVVAHAFCFSLSVCFGGAAVPAAGIASVGVAPEARRQGIARALLEQLHAEATARGDALALLFAFRSAFYRPLGYGQAAPMLRLSFAPEAVPREWMHHAHISVRAAKGDDRAAVEDAFRRAAHRSNGWVLRPPALWERLFANPRRVILVAEREGVVTGAIAWSLEQEEAHAETRLIVHDLAADDDATWRRLVGAVGAQAGQVHEAELSVPMGDPLAQAFVDVDAWRTGTMLVEHELGAIVGGPMLRVLDLRRALEVRGWADDGTFAVDVGGERWAVHVEEGRARAQTPKDEPVLKLDRTTLAEVLFGGLRVEDAMRLGRASGDAPAIAEAARMLAGPPFSWVDEF